MHIELLKCTFGYKIKYCLVIMVSSFFCININLSYIKYTLSYIIYKNNYDAVVKAH